MLLRFGERTINTDAVAFCDGNEVHFIGGESLTLSGKEMEFFKNAPTADEIMRMRPSNIVRA